MIKIEEINPVHSQINKNYIETANQCLRYTKVYFKKGTYHKEKKSYPAKLVDKEGIFYTGYIPRLISFLNERGIKFRVKRQDYDIGDYKSPKLKGIELRDDQLFALKEMTIYKKGIWQAPTGSGKTILISALASVYDEFRVLVLVHTEQLFKQTIEELKRFFDCVGGIGCGLNKEDDITVAMINTLSRWKDEKLYDFGERWGMVIVDEAHHLGFGEFKKVTVVKKSVRKYFPMMYERVLEYVMTALRFGFTATVPESDERLLAMEGLIGPVLGKTSYEELQEAEVLAKPKVKIWWVPETDRCRDIKGGYSAIYEEGIVNYRARNILIMEKSYDLIRQGLTVLIMVERIEHGEILLRMSEIIMPNTFVFLHGETPSLIKKQEKEIFSKKERKGVIATRIWTEGVNIKSVGAIVNAVGGLSEIAAIQRFGRGMRVTEDKKSVILYDFFDNAHYHLIKHSGKRMCLYFKEGWL